MEYKVLLCTDDTIARVKYETESIFAANKGKTNQVTIIIEAETIKECFEKIIKFKDSIITAEEFVETIARA